MKVEELVASVAALEPDDLRAFLDKLGTAFSAKAEKVYDQNPEENGVLAQPYADIADHLFDASYAFEEDGKPPLDMPVEPTHDEPVTVTAAVAKRGAVGKTPWGGR